MNFIGSMIFIISMVGLFVYVDKNRNNWGSNYIIKEMVGYDLIKKLSFDVIKYNFPLSRTDFILDNIKIANAEKIYIKYYESILNYLNFEHDKIDVEFKIYNITDDDGIDILKKEIKSFVVIHGENISFRIVMSQSWIGEIPIDIQIENIKDAINFYKNKLTEEVASD